MGAIVTHDINMWYNREIKRKNVKSLTNEGSRNCEFF